MSPLDRRDQPWPRLSSVSLMLMPWSTGKGIFLFCQIWLKVEICYVGYLTVQADETVPKMDSAWKSPLGSRLSSESPSIGSRCSSAVKWDKINKYQFSLALSSLPLLLMLPPCSTWLPTLVAPWASSSVTMACMLSSSMMTCPSKLLPIVRCHCCSDVPQVNIFPIQMLLALVEFVFRCSTGEKQFSFIITAFSWGYWEKWSTSKKSI